MIEAYRASKMKEDLEHPDISFEKLEKTDASYGFVLNGEGRRLKSCMARFVKENSQRILEEVSKYVISFEVSFWRSFSQRSFYFEHSTTIQFNIGVWLSYMTCKIPLV